jgi:hypothetical protein
MQNPASVGGGVSSFHPPVGPRYASAGAMPRRTIRGRSIIVVSTVRGMSRCSGAATPTLFRNSSIDHRLLFLSFDPSASGAHSGSRTCSFIRTPYSRPTRARMRHGPYRIPNAKTFCGKSRRRDVDEESPAAQRRWRNVRVDVLAIVHGHHASLRVGNLS